MGGAFGAVVTALSKAFLSPLIALIIGKPDYSALKFKIATTEFPVGDFINAVISFLLISATVYFFVVLPVNSLTARMRRDKDRQKRIACIQQAGRRFIASGGDVSTSYMRRFSEAQKPSFTSRLSKQRAA